MKINDDYKIETDGDLNVMLMKKFEKKRKEGEPIQYDFKTIGFYPTIKSALKDFARKELFSTGLEDLKEVDRKLDEIHETIKNLNL